VFHISDITSGIICQEKEWEGILQKQQNQKGREENDLEEIIKRWKEEIKMVILKMKENAKKI